jgi:hypothetical protein
MMAFATIYEILKKKHEKNVALEVAGRMSKEVIDATEKAFRKICVSRPEVAGLKRAIDMDSHQHTSAILARWKLLRPRILPFARGKLAD